MTFSLINSNNDFEFVARVIKTPCMYYFSSVKFHYVKRNWHMMLRYPLVAFNWHWRKLLQNLSTKDNERCLCQNLLTIENICSLHWQRQKLTRSTSSIRYYIILLFLTLKNSPLPAAQNTKLHMSAVLEMYVHPHGYMTPGWCNLV